MRYQLSLEFSCGAYVVKFSNVNNCILSGIITSRMLLFFTDSTASSSSKIRHISSDFAFFQIMTFFFQVHSGFAIPSLILLLCHDI
jgi:hypothetical protein